MLDRAESFFCIAPGNPVAWLVLEDEGFTLDFIREIYNSGLWLAPELDYQLIKAEIVRNGSTWASLEATRIDITAEHKLAQSSP